MGQGPGELKTLSGQTWMDVLQQTLDENTALVGCPLKIIMTVQSDATLTFDLLNSILIGSDSVSTLGFTSISAIFHIFMKESMEVARNPIVIF